MNVDKFGRHEGVVNREILRGPKGEGFSLTHDGGYDMKNKRICNIGDAVQDGDSVNLKILNKVVLKFDSIRDSFNSKNKRITNLAPPIDDSDAVNREYVRIEIAKVKTELESTIKALTTDTFFRSTQEIVKTKRNESD